MKGIGLDFETNDNYGDYAEFAYRGKNNCSRVELKAMLKPYVRIFLNSILYFTGELGRISRLDDAYELVIR